MTASGTAIMGSADWLLKTVNYEIIRGNTIWRFGLVLLVVLVTMAAGRIIQFAINSYAVRRAHKKGEGPLTLLLKALANPIYVAVFAAGIFFAKVPLHFSDENGIRTAIGEGWIKLARVVLAIAAAYGLYRLVDVIEYYLNRLVGKSETKLDEFQETFRKRFGEEAETFAAHAYDGMNMLIWAVQVAGLNRAKIRDVLAYRGTPFKGVTGDITLSACLDDVGDVYLAKWENGNWKFYSREDLEIPRDYIPPRDRVNRPLAATR